MYKITITRTNQVESLTSRQWEKGGTDGNEVDGEYGYTPQIPEIKTVTSTILEMTVDILEVTPVVVAILDNSDGN